jgi:hypothetical protein
MRISAAFPSDFLRAADLEGKQVKVVISHVEMRDVGGEPKPVLFFQNKDKGVVLNKTNANTISQAYGDDTDEWPGAEVVLYETMVDFQGRSTAAIRMRIPPRKPPERAPITITSGKQPSPEPQPAAQPPIDDDIPF